MEMSLVNAASNSTPQELAVTGNVLRKSLDLQAQNAATLIDSVQKPQTVNPPNLGQSVDVKV